MLTDTDRAPDTAGRLFEAARSIATTTKDDRPVRRGLINEVMAEAFGAKSADGVWTQRDSFVMTEIAAILAGRSAKLPEQPIAIIEQLAKLEKSFPTQTVRSEEQIAHQHFSTPLDLSWLINHLAIIGSEDIVLEPSAGIGTIAQWAGQGKMLLLNELDPVRAAALRLLFPEHNVTSFNAAQINQHLSVPPTVVVMNPPFARNAAGAVDRHRMRLVRRRIRPPAVGGGRRAAHLLRRLRAGAAPDTADAVRLRRALHGADGHRDQTDAQGHPQGPRRDAAEPAATAI